MNQDTTSLTTILNFLNALNEEDFETAKSFLAVEMQFEGVLGKRDGAEAYIADMKKMKFKYEILKTFEDGEDGCVLYNINMGKGPSIYSAGWYHLESGRINHIKVVFDPTPLKK